MYKNILIATDGSELAQRGVDHGLSLAKALGAKVTIITATEPYPFYASAAGAGWVPLPSDTAAYEEGQDQFAKKLLAAARDAAAKLGIDASVIHLANALPAESIVETAKNGDFSLIVMASHGRRGLGRLILGSETSEVLAHSSIPVLVVR